MIVVQIDFFCVKIHVILHGKSITSATNWVFNYKWAFVVVDAIIGCELGKYWTRTWRMLIIINLSNGIP